MRYAVIEFTRSIPRPDGKPGSCSRVTDVESTKDGDVYVIGDQEVPVVHVLYARRAKPAPAVVPAPNDERPLPPIARPPAPKPGDFPDDLTGLNKANEEWQQRMDDAAAAASHREVSQEAPVMGFAEAFVSPGAVPRRGRPPKK